MWIYLAFWFANIIFLITKKNSQIIVLASYFVFLILFVLNMGTTGDAYLYKTVYERGLWDGSGFEVGFIILQKLIFFCGIRNYNILLFVIFTIGTLLLWVGLRKYDISFHAIFVISMPFIVPTFTVAIRFFIAFAALIAGLRYLLNKRYLLFVVFILIAFSFHRVSLFYIILLFCTTKRMDDLSNNRKVFLRLVGVMSLLYFLLCFLTGENTIVRFIAYCVSEFFDISNDKLEAYTYTSTRFGGIVFVIIYFAGLITAVLIKKKIISEKKDLIDDISETYDMIQRLGKFNLNLNILLSVILPLIAMNIVFYRLLLIGHVLNAVVLGMSYRYFYRDDNMMVLRFSLTGADISLLVSGIMWYIPEIIRLQSISIQGMFDVLPF